MKRVFVVNVENMCNYFYTLEENIEPLLKNCVQNTIPETLLAVTMTIFDACEPHKPDIHRMKSYLLDNPHLFLSILPVYVNFLKRTLNNVGIENISSISIMNGLTDFPFVKDIQKIITKFTKDSQCTFSYSLYFLYWINYWLNDTSPYHENTMAIVHQNITDMFVDDNAAK